MSAEVKSYQSLGTGDASHENPRILALDVGTTTLRCHIYNKQAQKCSEATRSVQLIHPKPGWVEMDQDVLWEQVQEVMKEAIQNADLKAKDITCMGITTQRNTFITWDKDTGKPFHRLITWQDLRASDTVKSWNDSYTMKAFNKSSGALYGITRKKRFLSASVLRFKSAQVTMRLRWVLDNIPEAAFRASEGKLQYGGVDSWLIYKFTGGIVSATDYSMASTTGLFDPFQVKVRASEGKVMYGCIDTWLLWKLTGGSVFATDYSNASSTGIFDPFQIEWSAIVGGLVGIPMSIFPEIRDTSGFFGNCCSEFFGAPIPITAVVADQQAGTFGQCCFDVGDVKITMGTGTFIDCNTGNKPHASVAGLYPLVGWKIGDEMTFLAEGLSVDTGVCLEWAKKLGLFEDVTNTGPMAESVEDSGGTYFVPSFSGLQAPINDDKACCTIVGITPNTRKEHMVRAILESLAFRCKLLYETVLTETKTPLSRSAKIDGGVCNNNFLMQLTSNLINCELDRPRHMDMTNLGAAFLAGLAVGVWKSKEELKALRKTEKVFEPVDVWGKYKPIVTDWERAVKRSTLWYKDVDV